MFRELPKTIKWIYNLFLIFIIVFTLLRIIAFLVFKPESFGIVDVIPSFLMGLQYDLRWVAIILLPIPVVSFFYKNSPFYSYKNQRRWVLYLALITLIVFLFFGADFGSFAYNQTRLDSGAMNFVEDPKISFQMMWQTYPLIWILISLIVAVMVFKWIYSKTHWYMVLKKTTEPDKRSRTISYIITITVLLFFIYGRAGLQPLGTSNAFALKDTFKSYLALNPLQNFFTTLRLRKPQYNEVRAREVFPVMQQWMGLPERKSFTYNRQVPLRSGAFESKPNIVLVLCESFSMYKSSMSGNPLNTTPFFDSLRGKGVFFNHCFTPHFSTARGLFALLTGIPDAQLFKFSTRNPKALDQHTIINDFEDYNKLYFLGGSPEFNNFKGILQNINGLKMYTEDNFKSPKVNVWGISDRNLFKEANHVFRQQDKPFFAIVQTANNHRPFMIPREDTDFEKIELPEDELEKWGFESNEELNSFRYADFCFRSFIGQAQQENYFHNTIFVFVGDHGVAGNALNIYPPLWTKERLTDQHVPLLFYAPYMLAPQLKTGVASLIDVLPSIAGLSGISYTNTTLGRDLFNPGKKNNFAFVTNTAGKIGMVTDSFYFSKNLNVTEEKLLPLQGALNNRFTIQQLDSVKKVLSEFSTAFFETSRYLIMNNYKKK